MTSPITNSERKTASCPQRWLYRYGLGLANSGPSHAMRVGSLIHHGLRYLPKRKDEQLVKEAESRIHEMADELLGSEGVLDPSRPTVDASAVRESRDEAVALFREYVQAWGDDAGLQILFTEQTLRAKVRHPETGRRSPVTEFAGVLDGVCRINGRDWLLERKSTTIDLERWVQEHRYNPQAATYGWLAREHGFDLAGVCYDLILRAVPLTELPKTKPTKSEPLGRLRKPAPSSLPRCTAETWASEIKSCGQHLDSFDWYRDVHNRLLHRERNHYWLRREFESFQAGEIDRTEVELYHVATQLRRWHDIAAPYRAEIVSEAGKARLSLGADVSAGKAAVDALSAIGAMFPRNPAMCREYNRPCDYAEACELQTESAIRQLSIRPKIHSELDQ